MNPSWRDWRLLLAAASSSVLFLVDLQAPRELPLLPLFWLPAVLAAAFATPGQVAALSLLALAYGLIHRVHPGQDFHDFYGVYWISLVAATAVSLMAIQLSHQRLRLQRRLQQERHHYRLLAENAGDIVFQTDPDFRLVWVSPSLETLLGIEPRQRLGRPLSDWLLAEDQPALLAEQQRLQEGEVGEANLRIQGRFLSATAGSRWLALSATPQRDGAGRLLGWIGSCSDIQSQMEERQRRQRAESHVRLAMEASAAGMAMEAIDGRFLEVNPALCEFLGRSREELLQMDWQTVTHPDDLARDQQLLQEVVEGKRDSLRARKRYLRPDGSIVWGDLSAACIRDEQGEIRAIISYITDSTKIVELEQEKERKSQLLEMVLGNVDSLIYMKDAEHRFIYANHRVEALLGRPLADIIGCTDSDFFDPATAQALWRDDERVLRGGDCLDTVEQAATQGGSERWYLTRKIRLQQPFGSDCLIGFSVDITEIKRQEQELARLESKFRTLFEASTDAILLVNTAGRFIDANPATLQLLGVPDLETFLRCSPRDFSPEFQSTGERSADLIPVHIARGLEQGSHQFEWLYRRLDDGEPCLSLITLRAISLNDQPALMAVVRDISEARRYEERLQTLAYRDTLTGLPNRAASLEQLEQRLAVAGSPESSPAGALLVVNLDFDRFQAVNDSFGLEVGNRVLTTTATVLRQWLRPQDWLARLESDEFLILRSLPSCDPAAAQRFGRELQRALADGLAAQGELPIQPSASIGLALAPEHGREPVALLQAANTALMEAKRHSQKSVWLYDQELSAAIQQRLQLETLLERAIERQQLRLVFQPQVDRDRQLIGAEALLRWTLADGRQVSPDVFIPLAEQTGQMHAIGEWVVENACAQLASWRRQGLDLPRLAINLSSVQFENGEMELDTWLMGVLSRHGVSPAQLELEVTETALLKYPNRASSLLDELGTAGFHIAIDDFGTGYSSLVNLHSLPVHKLKIDKSFVEHITEDGTGRALVDSTLVIARKLGLDTMAEGVETEAQWQALKALGCDSFQGYLFGRPMPADELAGLLRRC